MLVMMVMMSRLSCDYLLDNFYLSRQLLRKLDDYFSASLILLTLGIVMLVLIEFDFVRWNCLGISTWVTYL